MDTILLTGFEPFLTHRVNPSALIAEALDGAVIAGARVKGVILPVDYERVDTALAAALATIQPSAVILCGLAFESECLRLERVALNLDDTTHGDNAGVIRRGRPILPDGPVGYWSTLPVDRIADSWREAGVPVSISRDAGGYLCNHLFFRARHRLEGSGVCCGFVHVPPLPEQVADRPGRQGMTLEVLVQAMRTLISTLQTKVSVA